MSQRADMQRAIGAMLDGTMREDDAIHYLQAMELEHITVDQLCGAVSAVMERAIAFPQFPDALDCCGTGGDGLHSLNISTAVAIIASACGLMIAKHGNRAVSSQAGSADVLESLGVRTSITPEKTAQCLEEIGLAFLFAPSFHPGFGNVARIRKAVGKRTIFNLLGPLCNPAKPKRQLIGVFAQDMCRLVAQTAEFSGHHHLAVVHGDDGSDEISISGTTHCVEMIDGEMFSSILRPQDAGLKAHPAIALKGGDAVFNARALRDILQGTENAYSDAVSLNCAKLLMMADKVHSLEEGVLLCRSVLASGQAARKLEQLIEITNR